MKYGLFIFVWLRARISGRTSWLIVLLARGEADRYVFSFTTEDQRWHGHARDGIASYQRGRAKVAVGRHTSQYQTMVSGPSNAAEALNTIRP